ncbi:hypothetical protein SAY87_015349 [Trapa incisa]|uniref:Protein kinase domain-containing protein n=1 Tax=Trapa incisa TaxID=236973 RepID=A0AAN7JM73_9MYRT|nr:hypothetical protein SAY87_015349 [Trapa incisa]
MGEAEGGLALKRKSLSASWFLAGWPIFLIFSLTSFSLQPAFAIGSSSTDTAGAGPPTIPSKPGGLGSRTTVHLIAASAALLALFVFMGIFTLVCLGLRRRRSNWIVIAAASAAAQDRAAEKVSAVSVVREFNWADIRKMTTDFRELIGVGGFSSVYLGRLSGGSTVGAVKVHTGSERLNLVFRQELDILLRIRHENIVKLIGFCDDEGEGALVFEYIRNGSLQEKLHGGHGSGGAAEVVDSVLPWRNRVAIAFQLAQAIEYLHEKCSPQIVHGDIKASNVLLDEDLNCKLCDFGSAKMGFSSLVMPPSSSSCKRTKQIMMGSPGYTDPHYIRTGIASKKNDIYSFGVLLLELVTGMEAFCSKRGQLLTSIAASLVRDAEAEIGPAAMDPRLNGDFNLREAKAMVSLSRACLHESPSLRPSTTEIVELTRDTMSSVSFSSHSAQKEMGPNWQRCD